MIRVADTTFRLRVSYGKTGRLRFLSHLEVTRACERAARRAGLPYAVTQGFTPRMKVAFGPALPVGTAGTAELYDLWLTAFVPPQEALKRLRDASPGDLAPVEASYVPEKDPSLSAALDLAHYEVTVAGPATGPDEVRRALSAVVADGRLALTHKGKQKVFDLAQSLPEEIVVGPDGSGSAIHIVTRMGAWGSLRPEALVAEALRRSSSAGVVTSVTRTRLLAEGEGVS